MMIHIANPIYDSVFKYLIEDERIARTLLSALLKKEVVEVHVRRHEYTNGSRDKISMFRIDFAAHDVAPSIPLTPRLDSTRCRAENGTLIA